MAPDFAGAIAQAGVDPTLEGRALQDALRRAIATRRGSCSWTVDHAGWVVTLHSLEEQTFSGKTLEEALAWCLVWLMAPELGIGPYSRLIERATGPDPVSRSGAATTGISLSARVSHDLLQDELHVGERRAGQGTTGDADHQGAGAVAVAHFVHARHVGAVEGRQRLLGRLRIAELVDDDVDLAGASIGRFGTAEDDIRPILPAQCVDLGFGSVPLPAARRRFRR